MNSEFQDGINEAIKRVESFKNRPVLQMRLQKPISDEQYTFTCDLVDAVNKLLTQKGS